MSSFLLSVPLRNLLKSPSFLIHFYPLIFPFWNKICWFGNSHSAFLCIYHYVPLEYKFSRIGKASLISQVSTRILCIILRSWCKSPFVISFVAVLRVVVRPPIRKLFQYFSGCNGVLNQTGDDDVQQEWTNLKAI